MSTRRRLSLWSVAVLMVLGTAFVVYGNRSAALHYRERVFRVSCGSKALRIWLWRCGGAPCTPSP